MTLQAEPERGGAGAVRESVSAHVGGGDGEGGGGHGGRGRAEEEDLQAAHVEPGGLSLPLWHLADHAGGPAQQLGGGA